MKFGKLIQAQQIPGWSSYYLDYKVLKKIISSHANRPLSDAASLALGLRPADILGAASTPQHPVTRTGDEPLVSDDEPGRLPIFPASGHDEDRGPEFQAHKATFFFKLERELEKINAFYLQKEAELTLRLETLLSKRRAAAMRGLPDTEDSMENHVEWSAVEEGFRVLERDLGKLQQFIELNATGFRKILKKWDKRSASTTKELYLARQVDVQPVFNRQLISELSDTVATCLLDLTDLSSGLKFEGRAGNDIFTQQLVAERSTFMGPFYDLENNLRRAIASSDETSITDLVRYSDVLAQQSGGKPNINRILWNVIIDAPSRLADLVLSSLASPFDFHFIDDINGRTCLHEASIAGALRLVNVCLDKGVKTDKVDVYGRSALHYASMNGHANICHRLLEAKLPPSTVDLDDYSPLIYATMRGSVDCVKSLLELGNVAAQPSTQSGHLIPLSLASQSGHLGVVKLLLQHGARCLPNSNGEYPMHLAAREGHADVCDLLLGLEGWDMQDKYHEWTPLFHAARYGRDDCVNLLLDAGSRVDTVDELGYLAVHYAAWYGHHTCVDILLRTAARFPSVGDTRALEETPLPLDQGSLPETDVDFIPSLCLPPPIMSTRVYGHNYLEKNCLVQVSIGQPSSDGFGTTKSGARLHSRLFSSSLKDEYLLSSTPLKLVMTTSPDVNSAPYTISLPQPEGGSIFAFQLPSLRNLSLKFSIYPNFGTKTIGRAVALPSLFSNIENSQYFVLPILDNRLHVIGEVSFEINIVKPFDGVTLEIGGAVETYWKSMANAVSGITLPPAISTWQRSSGSPGSVQTSPSNPSVSGSAPQPLIISSLSGSYVYLVVQVTRDFQPVVFNNWMLPESRFDLGVADITLSQFEAIFQHSSRNMDLTNSKFEQRNSSHPAMSLEKLLMNLPLTVGICLELAFPTRKIRERYNISHCVDLNTFVDAVLRTIYHTATAVGGSSGRRRIALTSFSPDVCTALNWKQPNYPTFFSSLCGLGSNVAPSSTAFGVGIDCDRRLASLCDAVAFSKANNILGVFLDASLLISVPSLIKSVRDARLLVGVYGSTDDLTALTSPAATPATVDATIRDGMVVFIDHSIRELT